MRQDPFQQMRRRNPMPPGTEPTAPRGGADRIIGARSAWPAWAMAAVAASLVAVVGGGTLLLVNRGPDTVAGGVTSTTASVAPQVTSTSEAPASTTTTAAPTATVPPVEGGEEVVAYFLIDDPTATGASPALIPVARRMMETPPTGLPGAAIESLLAGPTVDETQAVPAFTTAVPEGTRLLELTVADGVATVDLSSEFAAGSGSYAEIARIDQLVYTLTRFEEVDGIRLRLEGEPVEVFGGHGIVLDDPHGRTEFDTTLPAVLIETPIHGGIAGNPLVATGTANVFEATVSLALTDDDGLILWEGFATASCGTGCRGEWSVVIPYEVDEPQMGALIAWEESAADGSQTNIREHPVWLERAGPPELCSGAMVAADLVNQTELPDVVAAKRAAIFAAAVSCDWDALAAELGSGFSYSFGGGSDPVGYWQTIEAQGEEPLRYLAEMLNRPVLVQVVDPDTTYYTWPSAAGFEWIDLPEEHREALRPLYGDEDFDAFEEFGGYFGYRIGILADGTWLSFVEGD